MKYSSVALVAVLAIVALNVAQSSFCPDPVLGGSTYDDDASSSLCPDSTLDVRTYDGSCNNLRRPTQGAAETFLRVGNEGYEPYPWVDVPQIWPRVKYSNLTWLTTVYAPAGPRGNTRAVSNLLCRRPSAFTSPNNHSVLAVIFGQFVNHDFEATGFVNDSFSQMRFPWNEFDPTRGINRTVFWLAAYATELDDQTCQPQATPPNNGPYRCNPDNDVLVGEARLTKGVRHEDGTFDAVNEHSSYLDLNHVYGNTENDANLMRSFVDGRLKFENLRIAFTATGRPFLNFSCGRHGSVASGTHHLGCPPSLQTNPTLGFNPTLVENNVPKNFIFTNGDARVNENTGLTSLHIIYMREHDRIAEELKARHPTWNDETLYQRARALNIAKYQHIVYEQYFPAQFGEYFAQKLGTYKRYKQQTDATTGKVFAGAAFRYGHFTLNQYSPMNKCGANILYNQTTGSTVLPNLGQTGPGTPQTSPLGGFSIAGGAEQVIRGMWLTKAGPTTPGVDNLLRGNIRINNGFADLISLDLLRARHIQVPNYQRVRKTFYGESARENNLYGLPGCPKDLETQPNTQDPLACFSIITSNVTLANQMRDFYKKVIYIDPLIGIVAEDASAPGTDTPRTLGNILVDQYERARDGDRFFYRRRLGNYFDAWETNEILTSTFGGILRRNLAPDFVIDDNPFLVAPDARTRLPTTGCFNQPLPSEQF